MTRVLAIGWSILALVLWTTGCGRATARPAGAEVAALPEAPSSTPAATPAPAPAPLHGQAIGAALARAAARGVPPIERRRSRLLEAIPRLEPRHREEIEATWLRIKGLRDVERQFGEIARLGLSAWTCDDVVDLRALEGEGLPPFRWRDRVRGRTWASATLGAVLVRAYRILRREHPRAWLSLGDLAQPGCGSLEHGKLVRDVEDDGARREATALLDRARMVAGVPTVVERRPAADFLLEWERFEHPLEPVEVEHRLVAWDRDAEGDLRLRVETRRYRILGAPDEAVTAALLEDVERIVARGVRVRTRRVPSWDPEAGRVTRWHQHWIDASDRVQIVLVSRKRQARRLDRDAVEEIRMSAWHRKKPGSFPGETRWRPRRDDEVGGTVWTRVAALYEAGHLSHIAGRDADVSYVTRDNVGHFAVDVEGIDVEATWAWFRALDTAAQDLGAGVDRILVDPAVKRHMDARLPEEAKRTALWRDRVRLAWGHDAHHHLRLEPADEEAEARARRLLDGLQRAVADGTGGASATLEAVDPSEAAVD